MSGGRGASGRLRSWRRLARDCRSDAAETGHQIRRSSSRARTTSGGRARRTLAPLDDAVCAAQRRKTPADDPERLRRPRLQLARSIPGGPRISMPCSAAMRASSSGPGSAAGGLGRADGADEGLEAGRGRGHEPAASLSPARTVCGTPRGASMLVAGAQDVHRVAHPQRELALEDVEALVVVVVDVQRGWSPAGPETSSRAKAPSVCGAGDGDAHAVVQEPDVGHAGECSWAVGKLRFGSYTSESELCQRARRNSPPSRSPSSTLVGEGGAGATTSCG